VIDTEVEPLPPIPAVSHVIGIDDRPGPIHAIGHDHAVRAVEMGDSSARRVRAATECGSTAVIARHWGGFARGNRHVDNHTLCPECAWSVALQRGTEEVELAVLTPTGAETHALSLVPVDPLIAVRICRRLLADRRAERDYDADSERWPRVLGHVTAHRPVLLMDESCAEGDCDHDTPAGCYGDTPTVACLACSVLTGPEQGEWEGQVDVLVPAPCSVLTAMAGDAATGVPATCPPGGHRWPGTATVESTACLCGEVAMSVEYVVGSDPADDIEGGGG
jgi:hypothetical protein